MSVPKSKRKEQKLTVLIETKKLIEYTLKITENEKTFPNYKSLINDIVHTQERIYINCYTANNVYVNNLDSLTMRLKYQSEAILECKNMLALIDLQQGVYHLPSKRIVYWSELVMNVRKLISNWKKANREKYNEYIIKD